MAKNETAQNIIKIAQEVRRELLAQSEVTHANWSKSYGTVMEAFYYSVDNVVYACIGACDDLIEQLSHCQESLWKCVCEELLFDMDNSSAYRFQVRMILEAVGYC